AGGDVFKFLELHQKLGFLETVRLLAGRFGVTIPESEDTSSRAGEADREALLKVQEVTAAFFREQLALPAGARARQVIRDRGLTPETAERLGLGFAPPSRDMLTAHLLKQGFDLALLARSGVLVVRDDEPPVDRFRSRLMIPICRDSGTIVAFGGRAMIADQQPKYLNSPETAIYTKGRTLYGLHLTKTDIRRLGYAVLVEGYFDFAQVLQSGVAPAAASCGTALTSSQAHLLRRFANKVILSFDPDAAGQGAAARSCDLLVAEGFQVNVAVLPSGQDPDAVIRHQGAAAYRDRLKTSQPYLEYLLDRAAARQDLTTDEGRREFLSAMLAVAARVPDAAARDQFADRLAHKARVLEEVVRAEIRKAAAQRKTSLSLGIEAASEMKPAEKGLVWALLRDPAAASAALAELDESDLDGLSTTSILLTALALRDWPPEGLPETLLERLSTGEAELAGHIATQPIPPAPAVECARAIKRGRYEREQAAIQQEIDHLQQRGDRDDSQMVALWERKRVLLHQIEALSI
ncbi:MAG: DNA primase, partial [Acidobacteria bacterium]|nr:DNA primase [Acidobacteriota bacterium]